MGLCSNVTVLQAGSCLVSGPPEMIRTDKRVLDAYLGADIENDDPADQGAPGRVSSAGGPSDVAS